MATSRRRTGQRNPPYKTAGLIVCVAAAVALAFIWFQFRGELTAKDQLVLISARAGLSMDPGAKVTYNGVQIGRVGEVGEVGEVEEFSVGGVSRAKIILDVNPKYMKLIPKNVDATVNATTVFGNKYISFTSPKNPAKERITDSDVIDVTKVTTEFNTIFETVLSVSEQVDPIELNQTLAAAAEALDGLGDRFGQSIVHGNEILADINPQMPQIRRDNQLLADVGAVYANAAPDLFEGLENAVTTARTLKREAGQYRSGVDGRHSLAASGPASAYGTICSSSPCITRTELVIVLRSSVKSVREKATMPS
jgi:phospholipid/cholesterol/gamma-HCH transport system substrate-binding protein